MDDLIGNLVAGVPVAGVLAFFANKFWAEMKEIRAELKATNAEYNGFLKKMAEARDKPEGEANG
jgi:hypothetical protein